PPIVVQGALLLWRAHVDLFPLVLPHVADVEVARRAVPREAPRVPQAEADDLPARSGLVDVQAQELPELGAQVLRVVVRVAARAAVAGARVEQAVGPELQLPAVVVVELAVGNAQERLPGVGQPDRPVRLELVDANVSGRVVEVEEEAVVPGVARMERDRQEPLLAAAPDQLADVDERLRAELSVDEHADDAPLLGDVEHAALA